MELPSAYLRLPARYRERVLDELRRRIVARAVGPWRPYEWQIPPAHIPTLGWWLQLGGRGTGKTGGSSHYFQEHFDGPPCDRRVVGGHRAALVAPQLADGIEWVTTPGGLQTWKPDLRLREAGPRGVTVTWPTGARIRIFGCKDREDVERLRAGGNNCLVGFEELAIQRHAGYALQMAEMGLRLGSNPHFVGGTTPRPLAFLRQLEARDDVIITRGRTRDAYHLDADYRAKLVARYAGTSIEAQELDGIILSEVEGALWSRVLLEQHRIRRDEKPSRFDRIAIAIDPSWSGRGDDVGILAGGALNGEAYLLEDASGYMSPETWGLRAGYLFDQLEADAVISEGNFQAEQVRLVMQIVNERRSRETPPRSPISVRFVHASRGKDLRAEPIVALTEQGRVHLVGAFPDLEDQLCTWIPAARATAANPASDFSPGRLDAFVFLITELLLERPHAIGSISNPARYSAGR